MSTDVIGELRVAAVAAESRGDVITASLLDSAVGEIMYSRHAFREHRDLVRRLDVALNGDGAAKQASLCDLVAQFENRSKQILDAAEQGLR